MYCIIVAIIPPMFRWANDVFDFRASAMACAPSVPISLATIIMVIQMTFVNTH